MNIQKRFITALVLCVFVAGIMAVAANPARAQSSGFDNPIPFTSNEVKGDIGSGTEIYYSFTAIAGRPFNHAGIKITPRRAHS